MGGRIAQLLSPPLALRIAARLRRVIEDEPTLACPKWLKLPSLSQPGREFEVGDFKSALKRSAMRTNFRGVRRVNGSARGTRRWTNSKPTTPIGGGCTQITSNPPFERRLSGRSCGTATRIAMIYSARKASCFDGLLFFPATKERWVRSLRAGFGWLSLSSCRQVSSALSKLGNEGETWPPRPTERSVPSDRRR